MGFEKKLEEYYIAERNNLVKRLSRSAGGIAGGEDVVQDAFYKLLKYKDSFRGTTEDDLARWVNVVVHNCLKSHMSADRLGGMSTSQESEEEIDEGITSKEDADLSAKITEAIKKKKGDIGNVLYLYFIMQYKPRDIAEIVEMNVPAVKKCVLRFREEMKEKFGD